MVIFKRERRCFDYRRIFAACGQTRTKIEDIAGHPARVLSILCHARLFRDTRSWVFKEAMDRKRSNFNNSDRTDCSGALELCYTA
jgi:hypothetical protein